MPNYERYWERSDLELGLDEVEFSERCDWWLEPDEKKAKEEGRGYEQKRANSLYDSVRSLEDSQREAHEQNLWNARLYSNRELASFDWGHGAYYSRSLAPVSLLGENLILSVVDTIVSVIGKNRTRVTPEPIGASWGLRNQARRLDRWLWGEFQRLNVSRDATRVLRDSEVFGFGGVKVEMCEGKLKLRKVFPDDIIVDQNEAANTGPYEIPHFYERRCRRVEEVVAEYDLSDERAAELRKVAKQSYLPYRSPGRGWVVVVEGYRRGTSGESGRHMVVADGMVLLDDPWDHDWLPYVMYHFEEPLSGWYWPSVVERALPFQIRLNEINEVIRDAQDLVARPRLLIAEGSRVNPADIDNLVARLLKYTGIKPEPLEWNAVNGELYAERDHQVRACFEQFGLSQLVSQGRLPGSARVDSSAALNEVTQISDDRLATPMVQYEEWHLNLAKCMIRMMCHFGEGYKTVWYSGGKLSRVEEIDWKEIDIDHNAYTLTLGAASVFSMTPSARRDKLERWLQLGIITLEKYMEMEDNPDLESESSLQSASCADIERVIELLEEGDYESPSPLQDLTYGITKVNFAYLRLGRYKGVPAKVKMNFVKWVSAARAIQLTGTQSPTQGIGSSPPSGNEALVGMAGQGGGATMGLATPPMGGPMMGPPGMAPAGMIPTAAPVAGPGMY